MGLFQKKNRSRWDGAVRYEGCAGKLSYQAANFQGLGKRERQEDSFALVNAADVTETQRAGLLAVVADGMGGMNDGKLVSESAVAALTGAFAGFDRDGDLPGQLAESLRDCDRSLYGRFQGGGGTTAVVLLCFREGAYFASVGDSGLYLLREGGLCRLNRAQNYRNDLYLKELSRPDTDRERAERDPDGARLTEFLGSGELSAVDYTRRPLPLREGDVFLLCSDGVDGVLDEEELTQALSAPPAQAAEQIARLVERKSLPKQDNFTGIVVACRR